jgi:NADH-quinone oxidoreductase subunit M
VLLSTTVALPIVGALLLLLIPNRDRTRDGTMRWLALAISLVTFAVTLAVWAGFDPASSEFQFTEHHEWIPAFGIDYDVGVDGISLLLVVLTAFLTPIALLSSWESVERKVKEFSIFLLLLEAGMIGVFISLDLFLFYVFWDAMLVPMYFLIGIWGYDQRIYAAVKFMLYTMAGSVLMLIAILGLAYLHQAATGSYSFDLIELYGLELNEQTQYWFFLAFALAFAIKVPLFPFHTWLPDAHVQAPTAGSVILAGVLLKMGTYGLVRRDGAARHEKAGGVFVGEPPRLCRPRDCRDERAGHAGGGLPDAGARCEHGRAVPDRRHAVGSPPYAVDQRIRRPQARDATADRCLPHHHARVDWPARTQRVRR